MSWLALLQTAIARIPERLQLRGDMRRFKREHRIKAEALSEQVTTLALQPAEPTFTTYIIDIFDIVYRGPIS
jgi:hypothetical protein